MITAAVVSSFLVSRIRPIGPLLGVAGVAADVRHHRDAGLEPGQAERQLGEDEQRDGDHHHRAAVLRRSGPRSSRAPPTGWRTTCHSATPITTTLSSRYDATRPTAIPIASLNPRRNTAAEQREQHRA